MTRVFKFIDSIFSQTKIIVISDLYAEVGVLSTNVCIEKSVERYSIQYVSPFVIIIYLLCV